MNNRIHTVFSRHHITLALWALCSFFVVFATAYFIGEEISSDDIFPVFAVISIAALLILIWLAAFFYKKKAWPVERVYLLCGLCLGVLYMFLIPPYIAPDEQVHFASAYHLSNLFLHTTAPGESWNILSNDINNIYMIRSCDFEPVINLSFSREAYNYLFEHFLGRAGESTLMESYFSLSGPSLLYIISGSGIALGRLLGFNVVTIFMLGRLFNVAFFACATWYAMKKLPYGKMVLFAIAMMPMTLQQTSSLSYDNMILSCAFVILALSLHFACHPDAVKRHELVLFAIASFLLVISKGGAYVLLVFLPFVLCFGKQKLTRKNLTFFACFALIILLILFRGTIFSALTPASTESANLSPEGGAYVTWAGEYAYSISELLHYPGILINLIKNTIINRGAWLIENMVGTALGWHQLTIPSYLLYPFLIVMLLGALPQEETDNALMLRSGDKVLMWFIALSAIGASVAAMLLYWTPKSSVIIEGVQGRYFLPVLPLIALTFRNRSIVIKRDVKLPLIFTLLVLQLGCSFIILSFAGSNV